jgi:hypothetical protein
MRKGKGPGKGKGQGKGPGKRKEEGKGKGQGKGKGKGKGEKEGKGKGGKGSRYTHTQQRSCHSHHRKFPGAANQPNMLDPDPFDGTHFLSKTQMIKLSWNYGIVICGVITQSYYITTRDNEPIDEAYHIQHVIPVQEFVATYIPQCAPLLCTEHTKKIAADENDVLNTLARLFTSGKPLSHICDDIVKELLNMLASQALNSQGPLPQHIIYHQLRYGYVELISADQPREESFWRYPRIDRFEIKNFLNYDLPFRTGLVMAQGKYTYEPVVSVVPVPDEPPTV